MYFHLFKLSISGALTYRLDFFIGRLRNIVVMLVLYYVWRYLSAESNNFASYSQENLITYVFILNMARAFVFGSQSRRIAQDINDGSFSTYLVKPIRLWKFFYFRELGERVLNTVVAMAEVVIFSTLLGVHFFIPHSGVVLGLFAFSIFLAHLLYFFLSLVINFLAFSTREAMGPRFLFEWILEFSSGAYFPIDILKSIFTEALKFLPFMYLLFIPLQIYLGRMSGGEIIQSLMMQMVWIGVIGGLALMVWRKGLKNYTGEGI